MANDTSGQAAGAADALAAQLTDDDVIEQLDAGRMIMAEDNRRR